MNPDAKMRWKFAILGLLKFCKVNRRPVSITLIKGYLEVMRTQGKLVAEAREAFLWFVAEARTASQVKRKDEVEGVGRRGGIRTRGRGYTCGRVWFGRRAGHVIARKRAPTFRSKAEPGGGEEDFAGEEKR
jgi:hypothetical protein